MFKSTGFGQPMERSNVKVSQVLAAVVKANISVESAAFAQSSNLRRIGAPATGEYTSAVIVELPDAKSTGVSRQAFGPAPTEVPAQQSVPGGLVTHKTGLVASVGSAPITALVWPSLLNGAKLKLSAVSSKLSGSSTTAGAVNNSILSIKKGSVVSAIPAPGLVAPQASGSQVKFGNTLI